MFFITMRRQILQNYVSHITNNTNTVPIILTINTEIFPPIDQMNVASGWMKPSTTFKLPICLKLFIICKWLAL